MERTILLEQLHDRIKTALALLLEFYPKMYEGELETELVPCVVEISESLTHIIKAVADIQYNNNIEGYRDIMYEIAKDNE